MNTDTCTNTTQQHILKKKKTHVRDVSIKELLNIFLSIFLYIVKHFIKYEIYINLRAISQ